MIRITANDMINYAEFCFYTGVKIDKINEYIYLSMLTRHGYVETFYIKHLNCLFYNGKKLKLPL
jgi:hypothetical protein